MSTIREVAKRAGVSPITVSRVLNNRGYVSPETRKRVQEAIAELRYVPNTLARSFRSSKTNFLALIICDITDPFWTPIARGVEDAASRRGFNVILCNTDDDQGKQETYVNLLLQRQADGFLLVPTDCSLEAVQAIQAQDVPLVLLDREVPGVQVDTVRSDSDGGAYQLTRLLTELGHRHIAMLVAARSISTTVQRVSGYHRALHEAGWEIDPTRIFYARSSQVAGYEMAKQALAASPSPTALFGGNNVITIGALRALNEAGLRIPDDISVVSFDDLPPCLPGEPFLTVAAQPAYEMGYKATELLLARITGETGGPPQDIVVPIELVVRRSCRHVNLVR